MQSRSNCFLNRQAMQARFKQALVFFWPPDIINFLLKSLSVITSVQSKQICSFDDLETHTRSIVLVVVEPIIFAIQFTRSPETPVTSHATPHFWRETKTKTLQARQVDLSTSSLAPSKTAASRPNKFYPEIHEVALWQVYTSACYIFLKKSVSAKRRILLMAACYFIQCVYLQKLMKSECSRDEKTTRNRAFNFLLPSVINSEGEKKNIPVRVRGREQLKTTSNIHRTSCLS